jgi:predicted PurR-regulated permease PerM
VPIYVFYFLADRDRIVHGWHYFVPLRKEWRRDEVISVLDEIITSLIAYFRGQIVVASCNAFLTAVGLTVINLPNSLFLGVMAGALSVVPFLGIIVSIVPCLLLAFTSSGTDVWWFKPSLVLLVFALVQMIESLFISPRVQSHSTGLHPVVIILGILIWSSILPGLLGPILAVPLTSAMVVLMRRYIWPIEDPAIATKPIPT